MQEDRIPKIFISYSWSCDWLVVPLAQRLMSHGVEVVLDKWELKEGQDKYVFMEQCVNAPDISKVLIVCDQAYANKANNRIGGVGDETAIISSEVYGKAGQEKFIPIVAERDNEGNPYIPAYIKARVYIDLSNEENYEAEYEKLLRNIYEKPLYSKPVLGRCPEWIKEGKNDLFSVSNLIKQIQGAKTRSKQQSCSNRFIDEYIDASKKYYIKGGADGEQIYNTFVNMKSLRDIFLDFLSAISDTEYFSGEILCDIFERLYNSLTCSKTFDPKARSSCDSEFEIYRIHIWELFVCTVAYLRHEQNYSAIHTLLNHTYFLTYSSLSEEVKPANYCRFRHYSIPIEEYYKPKTEHSKKFTLVGHTLCNERERLPIYTGKALAEADLFLYQVRNAFDIANDDNIWGDSYWFPTCYIYADKCLIEWQKIKARSFCKKMYDLFGVNNIESLQSVISKCTVDREMKYQGSWSSAPAILNYIKLEEIGSLN